MDQPGQSINFDAHAMYADEENQLDLEEKQQQNELKELLTNAFDDLLDEDDDDMSSSSEFSNASVHGNHHPRTQSHNHMLVMQQQHNNDKYSTPALTQSNQLPPQLNLQHTAIVKQYEDQTIQFDCKHQQQHMQHPGDESHFDDDDHHLHLTDDDLMQQKQPVTQFGKGIQAAAAAADLLQTPKNQPIVINYNNINEPNHLKNPGLGVELIDNADLGSIDEDEFDELQMQQQNHFEFMNMDAINRQYGRLQLFYKVRGTSAWLYHFHMEKKAFFLVFLIWLVYRQKARRSVKSIRRLQRGRQSGTPCAQASCCTLRTGEHESQGPSRTSEPFEYGLESELAAGNGCKQASKI
jgi:hypothetical protein